MQRMSIAAVLLALACALAACQANGGKREALTTAASSENQRKAAEGSWLDGSVYDDYEVTAPMKAAYADTVADLASKLVLKCIDARGVVKIEACFRDRMLAGFDRDGVAAEHCPPGGEVEEQYLCIVLGSYSYQFVRTISGETAPEIDWTDPERTMRLAVTKFTIEKLKGCLGGSSASDPTDCIFAGITGQLGLLESDVEPCRVLTNDQEFGQCIGEAYALTYMKESIARI